MIEIETTLKKIISEITDLPTVELGSTLKDLGIDSLQVIILLAKIESSFDIEIEEEDLDIKNFNSVQSVLNMINRILKINMG